MKVKLTISKIYAQRLAKGKKLFDFERSSGGTNHAPLLAAWLCRRSVLMLPHSENFTE
jgi:hypothetical protein